MQFQNKDSVALDRSGARGPQARCVPRALVWRISLAACLLLMQIASVDAIDPDRRGIGLVRTPAAELVGWPPDLSITVMAEDALGDVWFGTTKGVRHLDDFGFSEVGTWRGGDLAIADLVVMPGNRVMALTGQGRLLEWSGESWLERSSGLGLREMALDGRGRLVLAAGRTVLRLDDRGRFGVHPAVAGREGWARDLKFRHGRFWMLWGPTLSELKVHEIDGQDRLLVDDAFDFAADATVVRHFDVAADGTRALWAGRLRVRDSLGQVMDVPGLPEDMPQGFDRQLHFDRDGVLGICAGGLIGFARWTKRWGLDSIAKELPSSNCLAVLEQGHGAVWVGTYRGPMRLGGGPVWHRWLARSDDDAGQATALARASDGGFWVAAQNGLHRFARDGLVAEFVRHDKPIGAVAETSDGTVYAASGTALLRLQNGRLLPVLNGVTDDPVMSLSADADGALWIVRGNCIQRFGGGHWTEIALAGGTMLVQLRDGRRLVSAEGLYELVETDAIWSARPYGPVLPAGVRLRSLFEDASGEVWLATTGAGIWRISPSGVSRLGSARGLPTDRFEWAVVSGSGDHALVLAAPRVEGFVEVEPLIVFRASAATTNGAISWRQVGRQDGIIGPPVYSGYHRVAAVDDRGYVWVAAAEGLAIVSARPWATWSGIPRPEVGVRQAGQLMSQTATGRVQLTRDIPVSLEVTIPGPVDRRLALWYRSDGQPWTRASAGRFLPLGVIGAGEHWVEVQARRREGLSSEVVRREFVVIPRWHERTGVILALATLAVTGLIGVLWLSRRLAHERRERYADLKTDLAFLGRYPRLVLAAVVQGLANDATGVARILHPLLKANDGVAWADSALDDLVRSGLLCCDKDSRYRVARAGLAALPMSRMPLASILDEGAQRIDRYVLLGPIGRGGQAEVHRAVDVITREVVALKLLRADQLLSARVRKRFEREADLLARIDDPGVVRLHSKGAVGDEVFVAMEPIEGRSLAEALSSQRSFGEAQARRLLSGLWRALGVVHRAGIVHRDLKPANVLLRPNGEPVLIDFGLAIATSATDRLTDAWEPVGTLAYCPPERINPDSPWSEDGQEVDWWAFGVIAHEVLLGLLPWVLEGVDAATQQRWLLRPEGPPRRAYPEDLAFAWRQLIDSCLERDPKKRRPDTSVLESTDPPGTTMPQ